MLVIVFGHSELAIGVASNRYVYFQHVLNVISRAAVPLFLILAGEHLAPRLLRDGGPRSEWRYVRRLAGLLIAASVFYWLLDVVLLMRAHGVVGGLAAFAAQLAHAPLEIVLRGAQPHLWFLVVLGLVVLFAEAVLRRARLRTLLALSIACYAAGLILGPYAPVLGLAPADMTLTGESPIGFFRVSPLLRFFTVWLLQAPLFFTIGMLLGLNADPPPRLWLGTALALGGLAIHALEVFWLVTRIGAPPALVMTVAGTVVYAAGVGMIALSPGASRVDRLFALGGSFVGLVYLNHMLFIHLLRPPRGAFPEMAVRIGLPLAAAIGSWGSAWLIARLRTRLARRKRTRTRSAGGPEPSGSPTF